MCRPKKKKKRTLNSVVHKSNFSANWCKIKRRCWITTFEFLIKFKVSQSKFPLKAYPKPSCSRQNFQSIEVYIVFPKRMDSFWTKEHDTLSMKVKAKLNVNDTIIALYIVNSGIKFFFFQLKYQIIEVWTCDYLSYLQRIKHTLSSKIKSYRALICSHRITITWYLFLTHFTYVYVCE